MKKAKAKTVLDKLLSPSSTLSHLLQGQWERKDGDLSSDKDCLVSDKESP